MIVDVLKIKYRYKNTYKYQNAKAGSVECACGRRPGGLGRPRPLKLAQGSPNRATGVRSTLSRVAAARSAPKKILGG